MDSEEDSEESVCSENDQATYESEHTVQEVKNYLDPDLTQTDSLPKTGVKKRKKNPSAIYRSKRQKLAEHNAAIISSVTQDFGNVREAVSETLSIVSKVQSDTEAKQTQAEHVELVFGQGKTSTEFDKIDGVNTTRLSNISLFQLNEETEKPTTYTNEPNQSTTVPTGDVNSQAASVHLKTEITILSDTDMELTNSSTETTQTNDQKNDDTGWKRQTRSMTKLIQPQIDYGPGDVMVSLE